MVKFFQSSQTGAPQLCGQPGALVAVLNGCLVNGYNLRTLTGITRVGSVATATADAGHGFREGDTVWIAGATEAAYNGEQRIRDVTTNAFVFDVAGEPATPAGAAGAITAKLAPLGWESPFAAPHKAVYRSRDVAGTRLYLRIDETPQTGDSYYGRGYCTALAQVWERLTDIDTGSGSAETIWRKAQNDSASPRPWLLVGDSRRFWLAVAWSESYPNRYVPYLFGDLVSFRAGDAYGCAVGGYYDYPYNYSDPARNEALDLIYTVGSSVGDTGIWLARSHSQLGARVAAQWVGAVGSSSAASPGVSDLPFPNPADNSIYVMPLMVQEQTGPTLRGRLPGLLCPLHAIPAPEPRRYPGFVLDGTLRELLVLTVCASYGNARIALDLTGPWD